MVNKIDTQSELAGAEEVARNIATVRRVMEAAGLHFCTEHLEDGICGCEPGRCASRREVR